MAVPDSGAGPSTEPMSETLDSDRPPAAAITSVVVTARTPSHVSFIDVTLGLTSAEAGLISPPAPAASMMLQKDGLQAEAVSVAPASTTTSASQHLQALSKNRALTIALLRAQQLSNCVYGRWRGSSRILQLCIHLMRLIQVPRRPIKLLDFILHLG